MIAADISVLKETSMAYSRVIGDKVLVDRNMGNNSVTVGMIIMK